MANKHGIELPLQYALILADCLRLKGISYELRPLEYTFTREGGIMLAEIRYDDVPNGKISRDIESWVRGETRLEELFDGV